MIGEKSRKLYKWTVHRFKVSEENRQWTKMHQTNLNYPYYFYFSQSKCVFLFASVAIIVTLGLKICNEPKTKRECGRFCFQLISLDDDNDRRFLHFIPIYSRAFYLHSAIGICFGLAFAAANDNECVCRIDSLYCDPYVTWLHILLIHVLILLIYSRWFGAKKNRTE